MSYCRWSSDNFKSDVYVYESEEGWITHVAGRKHVGEPPPDPYSIEIIMQFKDGGNDPEFMAKWEEMKRVRQDWSDTAPWQDLPPPYGGENYRDSTPQECAARLRLMKESGLHIPDGVIEELENEVVD